MITVANYGVFFGGDDSIEWLKGKIAEEVQGEPVIIDFNDTVILEGAQENIAEILNPTYEIRGLSSEMQDSLKSAKKIIRKENTREFIQEFKSQHAVGDLVVLEHGAGTSSIERHIAIIEDMTAKWLMAKKYYTSSFRKKGKLLTGAVTYNWLELKNMDPLVRDLEEPEKVEIRKIFEEHGEDAEIIAKIDK